MGLGSYWAEVIDVLREIIPVYDKVNSSSHLGKDVEHRNRGIKIEFFLETKFLMQVQDLEICQRLQTKICNGI